MKQRIAKKKLKQFYNDQEELMGWLRDLEISCYGEYPVRDVAECERLNKGSNDWLQEMSEKTDRYFHLERARLINAIRRW